MAAVRRIRLALLRTRSRARPAGARPTGRLVVATPLIHPARNRLPRDFILG